MTSAQSKTFGEIIAAERKRRAWSLRELADHVQAETGTPISPQYLNDIEHERRIPAAPVIEGLSKALDLASDYLFHLAGKLPPDLSGHGHSAHKIEAAYKAFRRDLKQK